MSAEDEYRVFLMENNEFWTVIRSCGDNHPWTHGQVSEVVIKAKSYNELKKEWDGLKYWPEHGGCLPSEDELRKEPVRYLTSIVVIQFEGRTCQCVDLRDTTLPRWTVVKERNWLTKRTIAAGLTYAEAIHVADRHRTMQPGDCGIWIPTYFTTFERYPEHTCSLDDIEIPAGEKHRHEFW